jgi:HlyD family secretion protein
MSAPPQRAPRRVTRVASRGAVVAVAAIAVGGLLLTAGMARVAAARRDAAAAADASGAAGTGAWAAVHREDLVIAVPVTGALSAVDAAQVGPPAGIEEVYQFKIDFLAPEGAVVRRGDPVVGFDATDLEKILHDKEAERDSAQQKLEQRRANLAIQRRDDELAIAQADADRRRAELTLAVPPDLKSRHEMDEARADLDLAVRGLAYHREHLRLATAAAEAELRAVTEQRDHAAQRVAESKAAIARLRISAPRGGTVIYVQDQRGAKKKVGDPCWRWEQVLTIPDLSHLQAAGEVDEADAGRVAPGQPVKLRLDAHPDLGFNGRVRALHGAVQARSSHNPAKVVKLEIDLARTDPLVMRPGMRFTGSVEVQRAAAALVVPLDAVGDDAGGPLVYRRTAFGVEAVRPRLGRHNDLWVEVLGGLRDGDLLRRGGQTPAGKADLPAGRGGA